MNFDSNYYRNVNPNALKKHREYESDSIRIYSSCNAGQTIHHKRSFSKSRVNLKTKTNNVLKREKTS